MCQPISGPEVNLEERWAWKVFRDDLLPLLYSHPKPITIYELHDLQKQPKPYIRGKWYKAKISGGPTFWEPVNKTSGGFHVFATKKGATEYAKLWADTEYEFEWSHSLKVVKVRIRGKAVPYKARRSEGGGKGWAVSQMMIPKEGK